MHIAIANGLPSTGKIRRLESSIDNGGLEEEMRRGGAGNDWFGLNIWWGLIMLRDTVRRGWLFP